MGGLFSSVGRDAGKEAAQITADASDRLGNKFIEASDRLAGEFANSVDHFTSRLTDLVEYVSKVVAITTSYLGFTVVQSTSVLALAMVIIVGFLLVAVALCTHQEWGHVKCVALFVLCIAASFKVWVADLTQRNMLSIPPTILLGAPGDQKELPALTGNSPSKPFVFTEWVQGTFDSCTTQLAKTRIHSLASGR